MNSNDMLLKLIEVVASNGLYLQKKDGSMPQGHNGPYGDPETPVRNTSHWSIIFLTAYEKFGKPEYLAATIKAIDYLLSKEARPNSSIFYCRNTPAKDKTNGLMGQAWAMEALVEAGSRLNNDLYIDEAIKTFLQHKFDWKAGGWRIANLDGTIANFDRTFNHQLWFCAIGAMLSEKNIDIYNRVNHFIDILPRHMKLYKNGLIKHVSSQFLNVNTKENLVGLLRWVRNSYNSNKLYLKSIGYHAFNTYALALIEDAMPYKKMISIKPVSSVIDYLGSEHYKTHVELSSYGYAYNPPGFEAAYTLKAFKENTSHDEVDYWVAKQLAKTYNQNKGEIIFPVHDINTSYARLYEATRILEP